MAIEPGPQFQSENTGMGDKEHIMSADNVGYEGIKTFHANLDDNDQAGMPEKVRDELDTHQYEYDKSMYKAKQAHDKGDIESAKNHLHDAHMSLYSWRLTAKDHFGSQHPAVSHLDDMMNEHGNHVYTYLDGKAS